MSMREKFTRHPASVGESYGEHFVQAMSFSAALLKAAVCCAMHAVFPFLCERTGSRCIEKLHERMVMNRARVADRKPAGRRAGDAVSA